MKDSLYISSDTLQSIDSIYASPPLDTINQEADTLLFGGNISLAAENNLSFISHHILQPDWLALVFLGLATYIVLARFLFSINFLEALRGLLKIEVLDDVGFDKNHKTLALSMAPMAIFVYAWYAYFFINRDYLNLQLDYLFLLFSLFFLLTYMIRKSIEGLIAIIFNTTKAFVLYSTDHLFILGIGSVFQIILLAFYSYSQQSFFLYFSLILLVGFWIFRLLRSFAIGYKETGFSKSYLFLYLCSLEILPIIWTYKWLINNQ